MPLGMLNWKLRDCDGELGQDKGWCLTLLYLHSNARGRCWPSMSTLAKEIGCGSEKADRIIDWLIGAGAIIKVPYVMREGEEKKLHNRKSVYQLTGVLKLASRWIPYLQLSTPEDAQTLLDLVTGLQKNMASHFSITEILITEFSIIETEGNTDKDSFEGDTSSSEDKAPISVPLEEAKRKLSSIGVILNGTDLAELIACVEQDPVEWLNYAIDEAKNRKKPFWKYIHKIICNKRAEHDIVEEAEKVLREKQSDYTHQLEEEFAQRRALVFGEEN